MGIVFREELENKGGRLLLVGTCFFPLLMADKSLTPSFAVSVAGVYRAAALWALLPSNNMCMFYLHLCHSC